MKRVFVCSPFRAEDDDELRKHLAYAEAAKLDCLGRGESPYVPHTSLTTVLLETELERQLGMRAGRAWLESADLVAVYNDLGISEGMSDEVEIAKDAGVRVESRSIKALDHGSLRRFGSLHLVVPHGFSMAGHVVTEEQERQWNQVEWNIIGSGWTFAKDTDEE